MEYPSFPYVIGWSITNCCNLRCLHCNMDSGVAWEEELSYEECCDVIDELAENSVRIIQFTGGEPLMRSDFFDICDYAISKGIRVNLTTNGTLVTDEIMEQQFWKFAAIRVSLDSIDASQHDYLRNMKGTYEKATKTLKELISHGYRTSVSTCISKRNVGQIFKMAKFLNSMGVTKWCLPLLSPDGRGKNISEHILSPLEVRDFLYTLNCVKKIYPKLDINIDIPYIVLCEDIVDLQPMVSKACAAAITELTVFANGDISPCFAMVMKAGNVREQSIKDIWQHNEMFRNFRNKNLIKGKCKKCRYLEQCGGGCRANPYITTGDYLGEDEVCWM